MPLRKSPVRTPALLAANRANAQKSTGPRSPQGKARVALAEQLAAKAWCLARELADLGTKPQCALQSGLKSALHHRLLRIDDRLRRIGLVFWLQRARYWTLDRRLRVVLGEEPLAPPAPGRGLEQRWRRRRFRLRKPGLWERMELEEEMRRRCKLHVAG